VHFTQGATTPTWGGASRHVLPEHSTVYLSYYVMYDNNWQGSWPQTFHPHEFYILSNEDYDESSESGLSANYLDAYVEHVWDNNQLKGIPTMRLQDGKNVIQSEKGNNLGATTGGANGCNGNYDSYTFDNSCWWDTGQN